MIRCAAIAWVGVLLYASPLPAAQGKAAPLRVKAAEKKLTISTLSRQLSVDISKEFQGYYLNEAKLLFDYESAKSRVLVLFVSGPSRGPAAASKYCGAGTEGYLLWLLFDQKWREQKRQSALIESCFESAEGSYQLKERRLTASWDNHRLAKRFTLQYDNGKAEHGLLIQESKIDQPK